MVDPAYVMAVVTILGLLFSISFLIAWPAITESIASVFRIGVRGHYEVKARVARYGHLERMADKTNAKPLAEPEPVSVWAISKSGQKLYLTPEGKAFVASPHGVFYLSGDDQTAYLSVALHWPTRSKSFSITAHKLLSMAQEGGALTDSKRHALLPPTDMP